MVHCALEIRCKTSCKKCHIHSIYLQFPYLIYAHFFVAKTIYALFCHKKNLCTLFLSRTRFTRFFAKTIYALHLESFCALKVAIRKVQTFWASDLWAVFPLPCSLQICKATTKIDQNPGLCLLFVILKILNAMERLMAIVRTENLKICQK